MMDALHTALLTLHFLGLAAILGGSLEQWRTGGKITTPVVVWGARLQVLTGLGLAALIFTGDDADDANHTKIGIKLLVALAIAAVAEMNAKKATIANAARIIVAMTAVNIIIAVAWK
jgi:hypothetical protein